MFCVVEQVKHKFISKHEYVWHVVYCVKEVCIVLTTDHIYRTETHSPFVISVLRVNHRCRIP